MKWLPMNFKDNPKFINLVNDNIAEEQGKALCLICYYKKKMPMPTFKDIIKHFEEEHLDILVIEEL